MKRFTLALAGLLLAVFATPSEAAWNLRQKGSGGAVWVDGSSVEVPIGGNGIVLPISTFQTSTTYFVPIHKKGNVSKVYIINDRAVTSGAIVANPTVRLSVGHGLVDYYTPISITAAGLTFTIATAGWSSAARVTSFAVPLTNAVIQQGQVLGVNITGPGHGTGMGFTGTMTIVIE